VYPQRFFAQQEKNLHGMPGRESNYGLPLQQADALPTEPRRTQIEGRVAILAVLLSDGIGVELRDLLLLNLDGIQRRLIEIGKNLDYTFRKTFELGFFAHC
jgi:hypothetical protein